MSVFYLLALFGVLVYKGKSEGARSALTKSDKKCAYLLFLQQQLGLSMGKESMEPGLAQQIAGLIERAVSGLCAHRYSYIFHGFVNWSKAFQPLSKLVLAHCSGVRIIL